MDTDRLIPLEEAAKAYGVGRDTMRELVAGGFFPFAHKAGGRYIIERVPFEAHLADPMATWRYQPRSPYIIPVRRRQAS